MKAGDLFDSRYLLQKPVGGGSFGEVWLATDQDVNVEVAIKIYIKIDNEGLEIFKEEFKMSYSLNHTNLLHANHCSICDGHPYIVMPFCRKGSLALLVGKIRDEKEIWKIIRDISNGLSYLHHRNIVHQDIKPQNILIDDDGNYLISDYGESLRIRSTLRQNTTREKRDKMSGGSIPYMAPERFSSGNKPIMLSDIWSLGATIYEIAEGELPYSGEGGYMQLHGAEMPNLSNKWSHRLQNTITECMNREPWNRPQAGKLYKLATENPILPLIPPLSLKFKWMRVAIVSVCIICSVFLCFGLHKCIPSSGTEVYQGEFVDGKRHGWGILHLKDKRVYEGTFRYGKFNGWGKMSYADQSCYVGQWKSGLRSGIGTIIGANGEIECGIWKNDTLPVSQKLKGQEKIVYGIDISKYQQTIDFGGIAIPVNSNLQYAPESQYLHPVSFTILKATEGTDIVDPYFESNFKSAKLYKMPRGAYHILSSASSVQGQINQYKKHVFLSTGDLPPILDLEKEQLKRWEKAEVIDNIRIWLQQIETSYGARPIIYANEELYNKFIANNGFNKYHLWIASLAQMPVMDWTFWQFSHSGIIRGTQKDVKVDINKFNGTYEEFCEFVKMYGIK